MKKRFLGLTLTSVASIVFGMLFLSIQTSTAATPTLDQYYDFSPDSSNGYVMVKTWGQVCQMFKPTKDNFASYIDLYLSDGNGSSVTATIRTNSGSLPGDIIETMTARGPAEEGWKQLADADGTDTAITANEPHWICVDAGNNTQLKWHDRNPGYYNDGYMINDFPSSPNTYPAIDMGFKTYGYNDDLPPEESSDNPASEATPSEDSNTTLTNESFGETSTLITKATSLTAKFVNDEESETRGIKLNWTASSTVDIDGYKMFRSTKRNSGYKKIGQTDEVTFEFMDDSVSASTTYYYVVRAFQATLQSASSNVASITTPAGIGPAKVANVKVTDHTQNSILVTWSASDDENLAGYVVSAQIVTGSKLLIYNVEKNTTSFRLNSLDAGEIYKISVQAKDNADTLSSKSTIYQNTLDWDYAEYFETNIWTFMLTSIASLLTVVLIWLILKRELKKN